MPDNVSPGATVYAATQVEVEAAWMERLTGEDLRALTPLIYANVNPYGEIRLDMTRRLPIGDEAVA